MSEQLSGRKITYAIAEKLGYTDIHDGIHPFTHDLVYMGINERSRGVAIPIPNFHADANATLAVCAERGWELRFEFDNSEEEITYVAWIAGDVMRPIGSGYMTNEYDGRSTASCQEAAARALLAALTATADSENGGVA